MFAHRVIVMSGLHACTCGTSGAVLVSAVELIAPQTGHGTSGIV